ncbi:hypothetical protein MTR67_003537 [Solanum verrucosum]|uniref:Cullin N-terminal domain-containing protein n=1 Tax=Solanum verrucosum TaxID=315347 RepID=A0AAF0PSP4_SOLVR|nr:hypothetical protein MTR67_003537 [Solanum verrucosum]
MSDVCMDFCNQHRRRNMPPKMKMDFCNSYLPGPLIALHQELETFLLYGPSVCSILCLSATCSSLSKCNILVNNLPSLDSAQCLGTGPQVFGICVGGITKLKNILEGLPEPQVSSKDYMKLCTRTYNMCTQKPPHDYSQQLYDKYREAFEEYITTTKVQHELLSVYATQLLEKEHSGFHALFSKIPRGLDPVAIILKQHVTAEGTALVKLAEDAASNKKGHRQVGLYMLDVVPDGSRLVFRVNVVERHEEEEGSTPLGLGVLQQTDKRDVVGLQEQVFVRKVIELHDKYLAYVNNCFQNCTLFHKALKEALELFCNKGVAGR